MWESLLSGFLNALQPAHLLILFLAIVLGFFGGAMPGISGATLILILLPVTYGMDPVPVFLLLTAIYAATAYSGSVSAILYRIPGTPEAIATVFDGNAMAKQGKVGEAMGLSMMSSAIGGIIGACFLFLLAPPLAGFALQFSSPEYFALGVLGLTVVASLSGKDIVKGLLGVLFGLFLSTVGIDTITGTDRFTFGSTQLRSGLDLVSILIGLFAISEVLNMSRLNNRSGKQEESVKVSTNLFVGKILKKCIPTIARSSLIGAWTGILPGIGATTAAVLSYSEEIRWSKHPEKFGTGTPEGIIAPETANNSAAACSLIPLVSLGIPGSATTAIILGAFVLHGLQPGPMFMEQQSVLVYTIFAGLFLLHFMMLLFAKPFISMFSLTTKIPYAILAPLIIVFCFIGTYAVRNSMFDVWAMMAFGLIGYFFEKIRFPIATIVLGVVLGPLVEEEFRRSMILSQGDFMIFLTKPISLILLILAAAALLMPAIKRLFSNKLSKNKSEHMGRSMG